MKASQIQVGHQYEVQAGRNKTKINVVSFDEEKQSWSCKTPNGKIIKIKDTARFFKEVGEKKKTLRETIESKGITIIPREKRATSSAKEFDDPTFTHKHHVDENGVLVLEADEKPKHMGPKPLGDMSALTAAHRVLVEEARPMRVREITTTVLERGYCKLNGKTPHCTINGGMQKEIKTKGENSRFQWVGKGLFAAR